jgi:TPR repeat protein
MNRNLATVLGAAIALTACATSRGPSIEEIRASAESGDTGAQVDLAVDYHTGKGVHQSYAEAARWYARAAESGDPVAQNNLGSLYLNGLGVPKDYVKAAELYTKSAVQGNPQAENGLGMMYELGLGVARDLKAANLWYLKAAERGIPESMLNLGLDYHDGAGVPRDPVEAYKWINLAREFTQDSGDAKAKARIKAVLEKLKAELSRQEIEEGEKRSRQWYEVYRES